LKINKKTSLLAFDIVLLIVVMLWWIDQREDQEAVPAVAPTLAE
jgi:hypothetical protein